MSGYEGTPVGKGMAASPGRAVGPIKFVKIEKSSSHMRDRIPVDSEKVESGDVLLTEELLPPLATAACRASAIVTIDPDDSSGSPGPMAKAAISARELGIPAVIGCDDMRPLLKEGANVVVDGDAGHVYTSR